MSETTGNAPPADTAFLFDNRAIFAVLAVSAVCWALAFLFWAQQGLDRAVLLAHNPVRDHDLWVELAKGASDFGMSAMVLVYLVYLLPRLRVDEPGSNHGILLLVLLSFALAGIAGDLFKELFDRARPIATYASELAGVKASKSPSFPSGHATKSLALFLPCLLLIPGQLKWHRLVQITLALLALAVCYSRILLGKHFLSDVLAAAGTATLFFPLAVVAAGAIVARVPRKRLPVAVRVWAVTVLVLGVWFLFL
jgi:membrane-associated phospholipid phosphatase